jgi:hypothetical protein
MVFSAQGNWGGIEMTDEILAPKFVRKQVVRLSLFDNKGKPKNDFARKALPYYAQVADILSIIPHEKSGKVILVYKVKLEDGVVLQLTEDCLIPVNDKF